MKYILAIVNDLQTVQNASCPYQNSHKVFSVSNSFVLTLRKFKEMLAMRFDPFRYSCVVQTHSSNLHAI
jgi:hypothetical protein